MDKAFDIAKEEVLFVHPSTSFVDAKGKNKIYQTLNSKIERYVDSITLFNGNGIFDIMLFVPCSITHIKKKIRKTSFRVEYLSLGRIDFCNSFDEVSLFGSRKEFFSFANKTNKQNHTLHSSGTVLGSRQEHKRVLSNCNNFFVEVSHIIGNINTGNVLRMDSSQHRNDFFVILNKPALLIKSNTNPKYNIFWEFKTAEEAENFISYCKTFFARACLAKTKINQNLYNGELKYIPWMDFTQEWTDERLYKHFNITEEEQAFIKEIIPPYYDTGGTETED